MQTDYLEFLPAYLLLNEKKGVVLAISFLLFPRVWSAYKSFFAVCLSCFRFDICYNSLRFTTVLKEFPPTGVSTDFPNGGGALTASLFDAYNMQVDRLVDFYQRINTPITYPDGMTTSLGIIYWGRDQHLDEIEGVIPRLIENGLPRFNDVFQATKTPARAKKLSEQTDIPEEILRVLKHDIELWLPKSVSLAEIDQFQTELNCSRTYAQMGLYDQLAVISAGQTPTQREQLTFQTKHEAAKTEEIVTVCDYCRTGKTWDTYGRRFTMQWGWIRGRSGQAKPRKGLFPGLQRTSKKTNWRESDWSPGRKK